VAIRVIATPRTREGLRFAEDALNSFNRRTAVVRIGGKTHVRVPLVTDPFAVPKGRRRVFWFRNFLSILKTHTWRF
jgi:hypothetical protein